jgi:ASCH domain
MTTSPDCSSGRLHLGQGVVFMKALTVLQPWAWAIIHGPKRIENRSWRTSHRGPLAIHAGLSRAQLRDRLNDGTLVPENLIFGAFLGVVDVVDCVALANAPANPFAEGPYCWLLENIRALPEPIPWRGAQMLWKVPAQIETILRSV